MSERDSFGSPTFSLWRLAPAVFLPALLMEIALGAVLPVIPNRTVELGGSLALTGIVSTMLPVGQILGGMPAGALAYRVGDRKAMILAAFAAIGALAACVAAPSVWLFGLALVALGAINATFLLARQSYLTEAAPVMARARTLSTLAGLQRVGYFLGPFAGVGVVSRWGSVGAFVMASLIAIVTVIVVVSAREPTDTPSSPRTPSGGRSGMLQVAYDNRAILSTLGIAVSAVSATRGVRQMILPVWAEHLGFRPEVTSLIFGLSGAMDMLLFYPSGKIMDRYGRLWVGVPSMVMLGGTLLALPFANTQFALTIVACLMGLANGIGSGILMTLGADTAPAATRTQYLAVWRMAGDAGNATGPLVVSACAWVGWLTGAVFAMGGLAICAAGALAVWVPRWSVHANRRTRIAAGIDPNHGSVVISEAKSSGEKRRG